METFGSRFHGNDERIDVESLGLSAEFWYGVATGDRGLTGSGHPAGRRPLPHPLAVDSPSVGTSPIRSATAADASWAGSMHAVTCQHRRP